MAKGDVHCGNRRLWSYDPQPDDPWLETNVGECPWCKDCDCEEEGDDE
jgi:hypothetical protein